MNGASREALSAAVQRLDALTDSTSADATTLAEELTATTTLLDREVSLRRVLTDPAQPAEAKAQLAQRLLGGQVSGPTADLVAGLVRSRWSRSRDFTDALEELANLAELTAAQRAGGLDDVEDEIFRFGRIVVSDHALRAALTDDSAPAEARAGLVRNLVAGCAHASTERLLARLVAHPRGRSLESGLETLARLAAERRNRLVAVVTSAVPLSDAQRDRLARSLAKLYGKELHLNLDVDPEVLGGIRVQIGDEVINGSLADRIEEVSRRMAG
ncbi:F0F1 ATP synthase subunit delta [Streptomyces sp. NPDC047046]|uniref:F0F1 ATP synthase subunit delta n=1 Tax=Streptomyces sp. NPDC047046 TaxID=3155378 RepID=UPI0033C83E37